MKLLVFAHRAEAQYFLKEKPFKLKSETPFSLFLNELEKEILLICDEGIENTLVALATTIGQFPQVRTIINMGVCGSLSNDFCTEDVVSIRSVYGQHYFHSFQTQDHETKTDLISTHQRVLNKNDVEYLDGFAPLVDREAWAIGKVAALYKIPFYIYKIVSDHVSDETQHEICAQVKELAPKWSESLYHYYSKQFTDHDFEDELDIDNQSHLIHDQRWHFTTTMRHEYESLLSIAKLRHISESELLESINWSSLSEMKLAPKVKAKQILEQLRRTLFPREHKIKDILQEMISKRENDFIKFHFDRILEEDSLKITAKISSEKEMKQLIQNLESFPISDWQHIFKGRDV